MPVSCVNSGTRPAGNQLTTSRSTHTKVIASPAPTSTRATTASGRLVVNASSTCPAAMTKAPATISRFDPMRSSRIPIGTCSPAYTSSCSTAKAASMLAEAPKRSAASIPATPRDVRCSTATRYVSSATAHTSQPSRGTLAADDGASRAGLTHQLSQPGPAPPAGGADAQDRPQALARLRTVPCRRRGSAHLARGLPLQVRRALVLEPRRRLVQLVQQVSELVTRLLALGAQVLAVPDPPGLQHRGQQVPVEDHVQVLVLRDAGEHLLAVRVLRVLAGVAVRDAGGQLLEGDVRHRAQH